jgi:hypothetical protein
VPFNVLEVGGNPFDVLLMGTNRVVTLDAPHFCVFIRQSFVNSNGFPGFRSRFGTPASSWNYATPGRMLKYRW